MQHSLAGREENLVSTSVTIFDICTTSQNMTVIQRVEEVSQTDLNQQLPAEQARRPAYISAAFIAS